MVVVLTELSGPSGQSRCLLLQPIKGLYQRFRCARI